ncbi:PfkB family carbohydrate kinase [Glacieibacterium frigidum]|uniref:Ribokinase n=1 Tax=Glacieibacterium frigidum TaxID=2593303 RepID=A0A552UF05_9SPHN|nr:PfkB family carbohydrate kinase [Glacieibacterium frigidum]TRW16817.1 ribokinase [Glacieibacterium frigidum]
MGEPGGRVLVAGSANADFVVHAAHIPAPGETVLGGDLAIVPGGKGANQAVAAARAGGASTAMLVALGDDAAAGILEASLTGAGVALHIVRSARATGAALITVSDAAENAITVAPGANADLAPGHLPTLSGVDWLMLQLETPIETVTAYARAARRAGVKVMLNVAPAQAVPAELLAAVDVLVANEEELAVLVGQAGSLADRLAKLDVPTAIVTLGARGCCALVDGRIVLQPAFRVTATDTTAAGDTFCGTLAAALARGDALAAALAAASAAAALATTRPGAQSSIPARAEVKAFMAVAAAESHTHAALADYCSASGLTS